MLNLTQVICFHINLVLAEVGPENGTQYCSGHEHCGQGLLRWIDCHPVNVKMIYSLQGGPFVLRHFLGIR